MDNELCDVCHERPSIGVASSPLAATTLAYCQRCLDEKREPYGYLVLAMMCCPGGEVAEWMEEYIHPTLKAAGKTREDLLEDAREAMKEFAEYSQDEDGV